MAAAGAGGGPGEAAEAVAAAADLGPDAADPSPSSFPASSQDLLVSLLLLLSLLLFTDFLRKIVARFTHADAHAAELVSTLQLCCCTHELRVLSDVGRIDRVLAHTLTYTAAVVHGLTFRGAQGNPACTLVHVYRRRLALSAALKKVTCQFLAAAAARALMFLLWSRGLSDVHAHHRDQDFRCTSPVQAPLCAAAVELSCAFAVQTAMTRTRNVEEKYRVHAVAAVITTAVYLGGPSTGAVFNPALAFSTQFRCQGPSVLEYCLVYWISPVVGMLGSVLLWDWLKL